MTKNHVHDCTGPTATCPCGYKFSVPPISYSLTVFNGDAEVINECFNCSTLDVVITELKEQIEKLRPLADQEYYATRRAGQA